MSEHPLNLALRFALELAALAAVGAWGWSQHDGLGRIVFGIGLPVLMAAAWGIFRVNGDPNDALVEVAGWVRLLLETAFFGGAALALYASGRRDLALAFGVIILLHYALSYDRVLWLLRGTPA